MKQQVCAVFLFDKSHVNNTFYFGPSGANGGKIAFSRAKKWEKVRF